MKDTYFESVAMIERLHRLFLEVVRAELEHMNVRDINNVQAVILYNIGQEQLTVGELTHRGYYLGSNVSYNLRKMVQNKYVVQEPSLHDRRSSHVRLSPKGLDLFAKLDKMMQRHCDVIAKETGDKELSKILGQSLRKLEITWSTMLARDLRSL